MKRIASALAVAAVTASCPPQAFAQDGLLEEIIVTGSRIVGQYDDFVPVVHIKKRPDFLVVRVSVESDSRDRDLRRQEIDRTLSSLAERARRTDNVELGLSREFEADDDEIEYVIDFSLDDVEIRSGSRPDTSRVSLVVKSPILESDASPDEVYARVEDFVESVRVEGRAVVSDSGDINYSLVGIGQYREPLLELLAEDSARLTRIFGDDYHVSVSGFESPVRWRLTGPMELSIYFPYLSSLTVD